LNHGGRARAAATDSEPVRIAWPAFRLLLTKPDVGRAASIQPFDRPAAAPHPRSIDPANPLPPGLTRETRIRRDARGRWWNGEDPIDHPGLARAFDAWLDRAPDGRYCLRNDINWAYVEIEGAPLFVRAVRAAGDAVVLLLSDGREEPLDPATLRQDREGVLHCSARGGALCARFDRHAQAALEPFLAEDDDGPYLALGASRVRPPVVDDPLAG
jgi:hypothetical protein